MQDDNREYNRLFKLGKADVNWQLQTGEIPDGPLHAGIKDLIHAMNRLPFLYTTQSGAGGIHFRGQWNLFTPSEDGNGGAYAILPPQTRVMFWSGDLGLVLSAEKRATTFKNDLEALVARSPGASIKEGLSPLLQTENPDLKGRNMWIDFAERAPTQKMPPHKAPVLPYAEAIRRDGYRRAFMSGLWALTIEYLDRAKQQK